LASGGQRPQFWAYFDIFGGSCTNPLLPMRAKFGVLYCIYKRILQVCTCSIRFVAYVPNFVSISLFCRPLLVKKSNFCCFFELRHLVVSPIGSSLKKLHKGAQLHTFPYPTVSKLFLYSNNFIAISAAQSLTFKSVTDKQTNRQTNKKNSTFLATPAAGEIRAPPNLAR